MEFEKYILTDYEKESVTYLTNETVNFIHSNGFIFDLKVLNRKTELRKTEIYHCGEDFSTYEVLKVELASNIPDLNINLEITPIEFNPDLNISVNQQNFYLNINQVPDFEFITINENKFYNVYKVNLNINDSSIIKPEQILYNKEIGIIQILMTNNETYTINK